MIHYAKGDLLQSDAEALVNTVNTVGVMGKGIALQFKNQFPHNYKEYKEACKQGTLIVGKMLVVKEGDLLGDKYIINFPTKEHWRANSQLSYIEDGLVELRKVIQELPIRSIAIPPLGCGNGGLDWEIVKPMIIDALQDLPIDIYLFEPNKAIKEILQSAVKPKSVKLTPSKAMLLNLMFHYEAVGDVNSLFTANKLAYFLQETGENLKLSFQAHHYGPYAVQVNHLLYSLNGFYIKGLEQNQAKAFETLILNYERYAEVAQYVKEQLDESQRDRLKAVRNLIDGFESTYSLELLASVDYARKHFGAESIDAIHAAIIGWNPRKANLFKRNHIELANNQLVDFQSLMLV